MYQGLKNVIDDYVKDSKNEEKKNKLYNILINIYIEEFNDSLQNILKENPNIFIDNFKLKMINLLYDIISDKLESNDLNNLLLKVEEKINEIYKNSYLEIKNEYSNNKNKKIEKLSLMKHCINDESNNSLHSCGGNFIPIYDKKNNNLKYVICLNCLEVYYSNYILMKCPVCLINYYSYFVSLENMKNPFATWEKYHCDIIMNEKMYCIKCNNPFYLNNKGFLFCKNCNLIIEPLNIIWKCIKCLKEFKSKAKIYNPLEFKVFKIAVKDAIIKKNIVHPQKLNCNCDNNNNLDKVKFRHSLICDGIIYLGILNKKNILVCGKCGTFCSVKKFIWNCPFCGKNFKSKEIEVIKNNNLINNNIIRRKSDNYEIENYYDNKDINYNYNNNIKRRVLSIDLRPKDKRNLNNENITFFPNSSLKHFAFNLNKFNQKNKPKIFSKMGNSIDLSLLKNNNKLPKEYFIKGIEKNKNKINKSEEIEEIKKKENKIEEELLLLKESDLGEFIYISENISEVLYNNISFSFIDLDKFDKNLYKKFYNLYKSEIKNQRDQIKIYNLFENKFLTEQIFSILTEDFKDASKPFDQNQIISILTNSLFPLKFYLDNFDKNYLISTNNFIKVSNEEYKFFPFINGIGEQYESNNNINIFAFIIIDMICLDENVVLTTQKFYNEKNKNELIKFLFTILRGKLNDGIINILIKMLETEEKLKPNLENIIEMIKE